MRAFAFTTADKRLEYLWVLRAFDHARSNYTVLLHAGELTRILAEIGDGDPDATLSPTELAPLLEQLHAWGVLERSYDGTRALTLAEYRNRHFVYQFSQIGYHAYRAVDDVLHVRTDDVSLARLALPDLLTDLTELAEAVRTGDGELVYRKLTRLDATLEELAERAARFYLSIGNTMRTTEATPESFLAHKDALLTHMREFTFDLTRYAPKLASAIEEVERHGLDRMVALAAASDERVLLAADERAASWRARWHAVTHWFAGSADAPGEAERLREATMSAITAVLGLLRRVTEARRGGVSRETQLRSLAAWFAAAPSDDAAHALFDAAFDLGRPRHLGAVHPQADLVSDTESWWSAPPVALSRTLAESGKPPSPGAPAKLGRDDAGIRRLRERQLAEQKVRADAAASLAGDGVYNRTLDDAETGVLLRLLDTAMSVRTGPGTPSISGTADGIRVTVQLGGSSTVVDTARGRMHLDGMELAVTRERPTRAVAR
ncbi:TIGR02677 family protein [Rhodococcus sp. HNM0569]|uniref:TIGR02677 family protein n=1 Tax=Rhodococcus sp. HNM0569 TaxID=2716340 RepID=UPI00146B4EFB|nr:TIGR02677 family protein [Rhodococcus sp. HNM0569]NLU84919.1 TIGR02677 family protein [Rhodococcus sp. HNM0569]